jgi:hypothetical protein
LGREIALHVCVPAKENRHPTSNGLLEDLSKFAQENGGRETPPGDRVKGKASKIFRLDCCQPKMREMARSGSFLALLNEPRPDTFSLLFRQDRDSINFGQAGRIRMETRARDGSFVCVPSHQEFRQISFHLRYWFLKEAWVTLVRDEYRNDGLRILECGGFDPHGFLYSAYSASI